MLSAFRPGYGCQSVLLKIVEDWKLAFDHKKYTAAIMMDLSKAFDCIPHDLILAKLNAYGLTNAATSQISSYLCNGKECLTLENVCNDFLKLYKGVPQGFILRPVIFNILSMIFFIL